MFKSIYYYIDKFNRDEIYKLNKTINIIYRNYSSRFNEKEILELVNFCKKQRSFRKKIKDKKNWRFESETKKSIKFCNGMHH